MKKRSSISPLRLGAEFLYLPARVFRISEHSLEAKCRPNVEKLRRLRKALDQGINLSAR
jgi:hypothetical protein